jgi:hypothetical protein
MSGAALFAGFAKGAGGSLNQRSKGDCTPEGKETGRRTLLGNEGMRHPTNVVRGLNEVGCEWFMPGRNWACHGVEGASPA